MITETHVSTKELTIVKSTVTAYLDNLTEVESHRGAAKRTDENQLGVLMDAMKDYPEEMTEEVWEEFHRLGAREMLINAKKANGKDRYSTTDSINTTLNTLKVATIALTMAVKDRTYQPEDRKMSLKKYVAKMRPQLQAKTNPATKKPWIRAIPEEKKQEKPLSAGWSHYLMGRPIDPKMGGNLVCLAADPFKSELRHKARTLAKTHKDFVYLVSKKAENLDVNEIEEFENMFNTNSTVKSSTVSSEDA